MIDPDQNNTATQQHQGIIRYDRPRLKQYGYTTTSGHNKI